MKDPHRDPLDELLRHWARHEAAEADALRPLKERVLSDLPQAEFLTPVAHGQRRVTAWKRIAWFACGAAAAALLFLVWPRALDRPLPPAAVATAAMVPPEVLFQASELRAKGKLLAALEELFNGRLGWVAEDGRQVRLGLVVEPGAAEQLAQPLAVRIVVLRRNLTSTQWTTVWATDLVTHDEQLIELTPEKSDRASLQMWAQRLPDGMIAIDSDLTVNGTTRLRWSFDGIQKAGVPERVFYQRTAGEELQVLQTVALVAN